MDVFEAIEKRHSYRGPFTVQAIPREHLEQIVQAGMLAPSGCNAQTTSFVIVDDPNLLADVVAIVDKPVMADARAVIVCIVDESPVYHGMAFGVEDCAAAVENILLATTALGYATVWIDGALRLEDKAGRIAALLKIPEALSVRVILPLGVPAEARSQPQKRSFNERAAFNCFPRPAQ